MAPFHGEQHFTFHVKQISYFHMKQLNKKGKRNQTGALGEEIAVKYLRQKGFVVVEPLPWSLIFLIETIIEL